MSHLKENIKQDDFSQNLNPDAIEENFVRQVNQAAFSWVQPLKPKSPKLLHVSHEFAQELNIKDIESKEFLELLTGTTTPNNARPYAMNYGGHQFGHWAGQLGDGRAINIGAIQGQTKKWVLQLKGAGPTPYSRSADGLAVLRSSIREYLCSEAMHHLGVPTTRALSLSLSGDQVMRDMFYDGNAEYEPGAIVCRASESFIRFGNFQIFSARKDKENLKKLVDFTLKTHFPTLGPPNKESYLKLIQKVCEDTCKLIIHWQRVGFVHGVMNTDNMSILSQTIDYGPYGWLENYDPNWTPNTTDAQGRRYRFGNQARIALWNLTQLANALYPLIEEVEPLQEILNQFKTEYETQYHEMMANKLGIPAHALDTLFLEELLELMAQSEMDMTLFFRNLSNIGLSQNTQHISQIEKDSYLDKKAFEAFRERWVNWLAKYTSLLQDLGLEPMEKSQKMNAVNPKYVLRNYMAQMAIEKAEEGDYALIDELYQLLLNPYDEQKNRQHWFAKRPDWAKDKAGCSMLSCSS